MLTRGKQPEIDKADFKNGDFYNYYKRLYFYKISEGKKNGRIIKDSKYYMTQHKYTEILDSLNDSIIKKIISENFEFRVPHLAAIISIKKKRTKSYILDDKVTITLPVDWKATKTLWATDENARLRKALVRHKNNQTSGYVLGFYLTFIQNIVGKKKYKFRACRDAKRLLKKTVDENPKLDYYLL